MTELCVGSLYDRIVVNERNAEITKKCQEVKFEGNKEILRQIVVALEFLHEKKKIVHRDLKPQNIFISATPPLIKVGDFGFSRVGEGGESVMQRSLQSGGDRYRPYGTHVWIGPEQYNNGEYCYLTDIFPLGCIFGFVLSNGKHPFCQTLIPNWTPEETERVIDTIKLQEAIPVVLKTTDFVHTAMEQGKQALRLMQEMLNYDRMKRPTATEILKNEYFSSSASTTITYPSAQPVVFLTFV